MHNKVKAVANARADYETAKAELDAKQKAFDEANEGLIAKVRALREDVADTESRLKAAAETIFYSSGEKKPIDGVEVKIFGAFEVEDEAARDWCLTHMPALLVVDMKAYEKVFDVVGVLLTMPGETVEGPKVTLARDLSKYLVTSIDAEQPTSATAHPTA